MSRHLGQAPASNTIVQQVPIGGIAPVLRSGDAYKAVGEVVSRTAYPALSAAFPRNGSFNAVLGGSIAANAIAYGAGLFVVVNGNGTTASGNAYYSADGKIWSSSLMPSSSYWLSVAYDAALGLFIALSQDGKLASSPDGIVWTALTALAAGSWVKIIASGTGKFVALGGSTGAASSADGVSFTARTLGLSPNSASYGGGVFLAISTGTAAATSPDGVTWTARTLPASGMYDVTYGNGLFVAMPSGGSSFATSPDGVTWTARKFGFTVSTYANHIVAFGNGVFVLPVSNNIALTSTDGIVWRPKAMLSTAQVIGYGAGIFIGTTSAANAAAACIAIYAEDSTASDLLYLSGTAGQFVRVK